MLILDRFDGILSFAGKSLMLKDDNSLLNQTLIFIKDRINRDEK